jgi:site-specific DNA-methyltransferase (adenine-specific)
MKQSVQRDLFSSIESPTIAIEESANRLGVSTATIRNWIKTKYLEPVGKGKITLQSLQKFQSEISGKEKLNQRANKSLKDSHDHHKTAAKFLHKVNSSFGSFDELGIEYEASLSESYRNKEGIYYTPGEVVRNLLAIPRNSTQNQTFCDPCCGSGNFIIRAIELGFQPEHIYGYDLDPVAVEITKSRIFEVTGHQSHNIQVADFLNLFSCQETQVFDYIYTNPPWGKKIAKESRALIGSRLGAGTSIDTCSLFFFACLHCLKKDGHLGLLLPESFFNIAVFESARIKALQLEIERLINYGKVFKGLVTQAQGIVLKNKIAAPGAKILCEIENKTRHIRSSHSFSQNPKSILNLYCDDEDSLTLQHLISIPHITLKDQASWGLGIVTGNNKKFIRSIPEDDYVPVYKGTDILQNQLKKASRFIPSDMSLYQQVASPQIYSAKEKLVYKFISSKLCFFYDTKQRLFLNSANILIPNKDFPIPIRILGELLSSNFMNWVFCRIFNTHKILKSDLASLPIHHQFLKSISHFNEESYLEQLKIYRDCNGSYRVKK